MEGVVKAAEDRKASECTNRLDEQQPMSVDLNSGAKIPIFGLGTWKAAKGEVEDAVTEALKLGYRHIDAAACYGNEAEVGSAIKASGIDRSQLWITSKLWNNSHKTAAVKPACLKTMEDLGVEYLDLYLIHWPHAFEGGGAMIPKRDDGSVIYDTETDYTETWAAMEELVSEGLVKNIGISNFNSEQVDRVMAMAKITPAVNQVECHPFFSQKPLIEHCAKYGIKMTAYSPLGSGKLALTDERLVSIADKYNKSTAQLMIRWQIQRGVIVIPKSVTPARLAQNIDVFDFEITEEDMLAIDAVNEDKRIGVPEVEVDGKMVPRDAQHPHYPFNIPY